MVFILLLEMQHSDGVCSTFCPVDISCSVSEPTLSYVAIPNDKCVQVFSLAPDLSGKLSIYLQVITYTCR